MGRFHRFKCFNFLSQSNDLIINFRKHLGRQYPGGEVAIESINLLLLLGDLAFDKIISGVGVSVSIRTRLVQDTINEDLPD